jgi:large subunit ribosomal protein L22
MITQAYQKFIRISPRKLKVMADSVRGLPLLELDQNLKFMSQKSAQILAKVVKQAISNAKSQEADLSQWTVSSIDILKGPTFKRWRAVSRGRGHTILKRTAHLKVVLKTKDKIKQPAVITKKNIKTPTPKLVKGQNQPSPAKKSLAVKKAGPEKATNINLKMKKTKNGSKS